MRRRAFLRQQFATASLLVWQPTQWLDQLGLPQQATRDVKITDIKIHRLKATRSGRERTWQGSVNPIHIYPSQQPAPYQKIENPQETTYSYSANYLTIETNDKIEGLYGPIDNETVPVINRQLKRFLIGKNPLAGEQVWDQLYRLNRHARGGHYMMAISAIDNALWDIRGKYFDAPVYQLLGGPTRESVPVYASTLGRSVQPNDIQATARDFQKKGFAAQKWFIPYGPGNGNEGLQFNIEMVRQLREAVGENTDLMFDAFSGWNLSYAVRWAKAVEPHHPRWIEEAFLMEELDSFVKLGQQTSVPIATGEHFYNRWQVKRFLEAGAISVVQADPEWCGGVSELIKICTIASAYGAQVIPHGHNLHAALHVVASQSPAVCPMGEFLYDKMQGYYYFEQEELQPVNGKITLPDKPGLGLAWDESKIEEKLIVES
ncbi:MAG: enolase C-terminal domain-like protein [Bacteroidota bacterium]